MNRGFSLPYIPMLLVTIGVLIYFFGWIVLIYVAGAVILITTGIALYDKMAHNTNCGECIKVKEILSNKMGINKDLIKTKHEKHFDTKMNVRAYIGKNRSILISIDYGGGHFKIIDE